MPDKNTSGRQYRKRQHSYKTSSPVSTLPTEETECFAEVNVGQALRALREERGLSIRALAEKSGLAVNTLSLIENSRSSPSVSTLQQLAGALQVPITQFFEFGNGRNNVVYTKAGEGLCATFTHGKVEDLGAGLADRSVETFVFTMKPGAESGPHPIVHTGQEFVFCLEGHIAYTVAERTYLLEQGDSLTFEAHLPHCWKNIASGQSRAILVLCSYDSRDRATELHFMLTSTLLVSDS